MTDYYKEYECIIGLEIHVELHTKTKIFCDCKVDPKASPNTLCCPTCAGFPGAMPRFNKKCANLAIKAGLALNCNINQKSSFDRKNYFYPDLPKSFQITQFYNPICTDGYLDIATTRVGIERIHLEEDAGKLIHENDKTYIDFNRCGVPLIEIVTKPDIKSSDEASEFLKQLRLCLIYAGVSDCKMNEGQFRCDVNISTRKIGDKKFGTRCEIKNLNSFLFVQKAIESEFIRQAQILESNKKVECSTMRFDTNDFKTYVMRQKESASSYKYFPEPDIPVLFVSDAQVKRIKKGLPQSPQTRYKKYTEKFGISDANANLLISQKEISDYFDKCLEFYDNHKVLLSLISACILPEYQKTGKLSLSPKNLSNCAKMVSDGKINTGTAKKIIEACSLSGQDVIEYAKNNNLFMITDKEILSSLCDEAIKNCEKSVSDFKNGKKAALMAIIGYIMSKTKGKADASTLEKILISKIQNT